MGILEDWPWPCQDKQLLSLHCDSVGLRTGVDQLKIIINWNGGLGGGSGVQILFSWDWQQLRRAADRSWAGAGDSVAHEPSHAINRTELKLYHIYHSHRDGAGTGGELNNLNQFWHLYQAGELFILFNWCINQQSHVYIYTLLHSNFMLQFTVCYADRKYSDRVRTWISRTVSEHL